MGAACVLWPGCCLGATCMAEGEGPPGRAVWFHSPPFLLRMEAWNQETKDNMNGMHSSCIHSELQPCCLPAVPLPASPPASQHAAGSGPGRGTHPGLALALGMKAEEQHLEHPPCTPWREVKCSSGPHGQGLAPALYQPHHRDKPSSSSSD